jgi:hypothetical protein
VPWLRQLLKVPADAVWPRYMTAPHPRAVGTIGPEFCEWAERRSGKPLRWWQQLVACRLLEVDVDGALVWEALVLTLARQVGKSWLLRELCLWRIHQGDHFGDAQLVLHTGKDLSICKEMQHRARLWAKAQPDLFKVREVNGQEEIEYLADGSRWMLRAKEAVYGFSVDLAVADEAWKVSAASVEEGLVPTMIERAQSQLILVTTSHRRMTSLVIDRRTACLEHLDAPAGWSDLFIEWSAPRSCQLDDVGAWRQASPFWHARRESHIRRALERATAGKSIDSDEPDPLEAFRSQWLNEAPLVAEGPQHGLPLLGDGTWAGRHGSVVPVGAGWVALADNGGEGAAVAFAAVDAAGVFEVDGVVCESWDEALVWARKFVDASPGARLVVDPAVEGQVPRDFPNRSAVSRAKAVDAARALSLLRDLVATGRVVHDETAALDAQLEAARVRLVAGSGVLALLPGARSDLLRAVLWALWAAQTPTLAPRVH